MHRHAYLVCDLEYDLTSVSDGPEVSCRDKDSSEAHLAAILVGLHLLVRIGGFRPREDLQLGSAAFRV